MTIFRSKHDKENPYVLCGKCCVDDERLSYKALGLLLYLLSKPDTWQAQQEELVQRHKDGKSSVRSALLELEEYGYISRRQLFNDRGQFAGYAIDVYESCRKPETGNRKPENGTTVADVHEPAPNGLPASPQAPVVVQDVQKPPVVVAVIRKPESGFRPLVSNDLVSNDVSKEKVSKEGVEIVGDLNDPRIRLDDPPSGPRSQPVQESFRIKPNPKLVTFYDPRKVDRSTGKIPYGEGTTPVEVWMEFHLIGDRDQKPDEFALVTMQKDVTDLEKWRSILARCALESWKPKNIASRLDVYRAGWKGKSRNGTRPNLESSTGSSSTSAARSELERRERKLHVDLVAGLLSEEEYNAAVDALEREFGISL